MEVNVINMEGKKVNTVELPSSLFDAPIYEDMMYQAYIRQMANARLGTHSTKGRSDVSGGGRKPWRQKGTGRARQGSIRAAQWVGGGKIHTPKPRDYAQSMPRKMRRAALRSALTVKAQSDCIIVVDELKLEEPKTRLMAKALDVMINEGTVLIIVPESQGVNDNAVLDDVMRATNNIPYAKIIRSNYLNIRDLIKFDRLVIPVVVLDELVATFGSDRVKVA